MRVYQRDSVIFPLSGIIRVLVGKTMLALTITGQKIEGLDSKPGFHLSKITSIEDRSGQALSDDSGNGSDDNMHSQSA